MPIYVMMTSLTAEGRKTIMKNPGRIWEVNKEVEDMGAKILCQYALLGQYDFINILEASNAQVIARVSSALGARGTVVPLAMTAISMEDLIKEMQMAKAINKDIDKPDR